MDFEPDPFAAELGDGLCGHLASLPASDEEAATRQTHDLLVRLDLFSLEIPADLGGLGAGLVSGIVVSEAMGRRVLRDTYRSTALLADVLRYDPTRSAEGFIKQVAAGTLIGAAACVPSGAVLASDGAACTLTGTWHVIDPVEQADALVVVARTGSRHRLVAVPLPCAPGGRVEPLAVADCAPATGPGPSYPLVAARIRQAAYLLGLASGAHVLAVGRATSRRQFGRPIREFQAVGLRLAERAAELEAVRLLVQRAAWLADRGVPGLARAGTEALAYAAEIALGACRDSMQIHGAYGMSRQAPVSRYYLAAGAEVSRWGSPRALWVEAAGLLREDPAAEADECGGWVT
jgi:alkylation response protein AidB-like acyl-CoA dehydrogenase